MSFPALASNTLDGNDSQYAVPDGLQTVRASREARRPKMRWEGTRVGGLAEACY